MILSDQSNLETLALSMAESIAKYALKLLYLDDLNACM